MAEPEPGSILLYGATGFTGELIAREAVNRGLRPVLAGRSRETVGAMAGEMALPHRSFALSDPEAVRAGLEGVSLVLHAAGPFGVTSKPMVQACLASGVHYLDITGEIAVFERVLARDAAAREAGVVLLPGVGFDVVPSDCLAATLAEALPGARSLELAFTSIGGTWSRGTLRTMISGLGEGGAERRGGRLVRIPTAEHLRRVPFPSGERTAISIPWGDVATAWRTTGIPDIRVYSALPTRLARRLHRFRRLMPLAGLSWIRRWLLGRVDRMPAGPDRQQREAARMELWGRAEAEDGSSVEATMTTPEGYLFTAVASVECAARVLAGQVPPGAWTPASAFGAAFAASLPGVEQGPLLHRESAAERSEPVL